MGVICIGLAFWRFYKGGDTHTEPIASWAFVFWSWKSYFELHIVNASVYAWKHYFMYENIILNNNVFMTRVYFTHALKLIIYKQILLLH